MLIAIAARLILLFSFPNLSNDIYRFVWDGLLMHEGIHPLTYTPTEIINQGLASSELMRELYAAMNSPDYFTIYPPVSQMVFYLTTLPNIVSVSSAALIMKSILLIAELGSFYFIYKLLKTLNLNKGKILIYALNPLIIVEIMGNVHYEGIMLFFLLGSIYFLIRNRFLLAGSFFSISIAAKLLPLMFLPLILTYLYKRRGWSGLRNFISALSLCMAILFIPFFLGLDVDHFLDSVGLYFRKFEFNASLYYALREAGQLVTGYNQIIILGPLLSLTALGLIVKIALDYYRSGDKDLILISSMFLSFVIYLLCATTVHPWYLIVPIGLSVFCNRIWILVWSFLIVLSYSTYQSSDFTQNLYLISLEYVIVLLVWYVERKTRIN